MYCASAARAWNDHPSPCSLPPPVAEFRCQAPGERFGAWSPWSGRIREQPLARSALRSGKLAAHAYLGRLVDPTGGVGGRSCQVSRWCPKRGFVPVADEHLRKHKPLGELSAVKSRSDPGSVKGSTPSDGGFRPRLRPPELRRVCDCKCCTLRLGRDGMIGATCRPGRACGARIHDCRSRMSKLRKRMATDFLRAFAQGAKRGRRHWYRSVDPRSFRPQSTFLMQRSSRSVRKRAARPCVAIVPVSPPARRGTFDGGEGDYWVPPRGESFGAVMVEFLAAPDVVLCGSGPGFSASRMRHRYPQFYHRRPARISANRATAPWGQPSPIMSG